MEFLIEYGLFLAKAVTIVAAIGIVLALVVSAGMRPQGEDKGHLDVRKINDKFHDLAESVCQVVLSPELIKARHKEEKKQAKLDKKQRKAALKNKAIDDQAKSEESKSGESETEEDDTKKRVFVVDFDGDVKASATEQLRQVITAILSVAKKTDEVVLRLESPGGMVHSYGLAASQLKRITARDIPLTVCVDKVAASGGYMMACVADKIVSAPFAIIGSIGVVAQLPNFHRLLKKHDVDYEMFTAGEYKRTVTVFGENTEKDREKFIEDLEDTHVLFKDFITENRASVDIEAVATGEHWFGTRALERNLIDVIDTSDQYLFEMKDDSDIFELKYVMKKSLPEKLGMSAEIALERVIGRWFQRLNTGKLFT